MPLSSRSRLGAVHPRTRGEHFLPGRRGADYSGSSPHTRGTRIARRGFAARDRFIPAHAGNTTTNHSQSADGPVHPRTRGEHGLTRRRTRGSGGSSPHTRGTRRSSRLACGETRFIPAHAGNTRSIARIAPGGSVHPRTRGEHLAGWAAGDWVYGSSPHTRGTRGKVAFDQTARRFIPAHAGNTSNRPYRFPGQPVHPRTRGEHCPVAVSDRLPGGSSPHTRGTRLPGRLRPRGNRFIPAHAGNTRSAAERAAPPTVHPRTRGEHDCNSQFSAIAVGSSPHTRGTRREAGDRNPGCRFIPAHAGNTSRIPISWSRCAVHPRTRGEHVGLVRKYEQGDGSSPHTRGTPRSCISAPGH